MKTNDNHLFKEVRSKQIELGRQLQIDYPDIVNEYKDIKKGIDNIVLNIMDKYNLHSEDIAKGVLQMALHGYNEGGSSVKIPGYKGLISERDMLDISLQRRFYRNS
jgi:hypothetical protein